MTNYQFRSEPMALCQLILQTDAAFNCLSELGELGMVQFKDLNGDKSIFQRKYINEVRRCEALERIINFLTKEICKREIPIPNDEPSPPAAHERVMADYETKLEQLEKEVKSINNSLNLLTKNFLELTELKHLLRKTQSFFDQVEGRHVLEPYYPPAKAAGHSQSYSGHSSREMEGFPIEHDIQDRVAPASTDDDDLILFDSFMGASLPLRGRQAGDLLSQHTRANPVSSVHSFRLRFIAGVIARERLTYFEKMLFRISHGNVLLKYSDIDTPLVTSVDSDKQVFKAVFLVFFQGEQLKSKILKICEGFHASVYPCPDSQSARREMAMGVMTRLEDLNIVMNQTQEHQMNILISAAQRLWTWSISIMKTKSIYHTMNMFSLDFTRKSLIGECWCPAKELTSIQNNLRVGTEKSEASESSAILHRLPVTSEDPPTYNRANKILDVFQNIVDAYGVSSYMEINPAVFSIVTFPFLFSLMFGDLGHGLILAIFGLLLAFGEKHFHPKLRSHEVVKMILTGKYMILMMGIFSMHSGLIYNDCFAKSINLFGSQWLTKNISEGDLEAVSHMSLNPNSNQFTGNSYIFGMDPVWQMAENKITWLNSFKMKISIVFGVLHMLFGVILSVFNHRFFNNRLNIICEFVPQMIFLIFTFGYLVALIFHKWIAYDATMSNEAPSLLIGFINMFLMTYPDEPANAVVSPAKKGLQIFLLLSALICVPWMLLSKPLILRRRAQVYNRKSVNGSSVAFHRKSTSRHTNRSTNHRPDEDLLLLGSDDEDDESQFNESALSTQQRVSSEGSRSQQIDHIPIFQFDFGEVFVTQCIHTIEYCLGCISHTASYLRLWALSLAHAQLSEVLWKMILHLGLTLGAGSAWGAFFIFIFFPPWAFLTVIILLCMEGLSAFLHTLRLHWIEFMSKFFVGSGHLFDPFSFKSIDLPSSDD